MFFKTKQTCKLFLVYSLGCQETLIWTSFWKNEWNSFNVAHLSWYMVAYRERDQENMTSISFLAIKYNKILDMNTKNLLDNFKWSLFQTVWLFCSEIPNLNTSQNMNFLIMEKCKCFIVELIMNIHYWQANLKIKPEFPISEIIQWVISNYRLVIKKLRGKSEIEKTK